MALSAGTEAAVADKLAWEALLTDGNCAPKLSWTGPFPRDFRSVDDPASLDFSILIDKSWIAMSLRRS